MHLLRHRRNCAAPPAVTSRRFFLLLLCLLAGTARADPARRIPLDLATTRIGFRAYAFGLLPIDGAFTRFDGTLTLEGGGNGEPGTICSIVLRVEVASLELIDPDIRADVLSPNLLDAERYPVLAFAGSCRGPSIAGSLTLHGVSRPLVLAVTRGDGEVIAEGSLLRTEWGITGRPVLAGRTVRLRVTVQAPP